MLWSLLVERCGTAFTLALASLSIAIWGTGIAMLLGLLRRDAAPSPRALDVLARVGALSTQIGLLGSVAGMLIAFSDSESSGLDEALSEALALSYWSTAFGIFNALVANGFALLIATFSKHAPEP